jgi:signal recognition particle subunit SRP54
MGMLPGMGQFLMPGDTEGNNRLKRFMYIMDSMTDDELDGKVNKEIRTCESLIVVRTGGHLTVQNGANRERIWHSPD